MGIETGVTTIYELDAANPTSGDTAKDGDNHIRLIKSALKATFAGITAPITATHTEINKLAGLATTRVELNQLVGLTVGSGKLNLLSTATSNIQTQINTLIASLQGQITALTTSTNAQFASINATLASLGAGLGFTPVRQGGGANMGTNVIKIGWNSLTGGGLRAAKDADDLGLIALQSDVAGLVAAALSGSTFDSVGSVGMFSYTGSITALTPGTVVAGSTLKWAGEQSTKVYSTLLDGEGWVTNASSHSTYATSPTGTWMCLGYLSAVPDSILGRTSERLRSSVLFKRVT